VSRSTAAKRQRGSMPLIRQLGLRSFASARDGRRRPRRPSPVMIAEMTDWASYALRERLWNLPEGSRRVGRPLRLNGEVVGRFLMAVRAGNYREVAAAYAGISRATLYRWLRDPKPPFVALRAAIDQAEAQVEVEVVANLMRLSAKSTRAAEFLLTRRFRARWAQPSGQSRSSITSSSRVRPAQIANGAYLVVPRELVEGSSLGV
jgi:hypothetical protein